jgi:hypothetical protein
VHDWASFGLWEERHKELVREAEHRRLVRQLHESREEPPAGSWRRIFALLGALAIPFFGAFSTGRGHK